MGRSFWVGAVVLVGCAGAVPAEAPERAPAEAEAPDGAESESEAIRAAWRAYRESLVRKDGQRALTLVTPESIADYGRQLDLALKATRSDLLEADLLDRYTVLMVRARLTPERLRSLDSRSFLALAIDRGWVGSDLPNDIVVKRVEQDIAYVTLVKDGQEIPVEIQMMRRVQGTWRVDLLALIRFARPAFVQLFAELGKREGTDVNGAMLLVIERLSGMKPLDSVWDPPR